VWIDAIPNDTRICQVDTLTRPASPNLYPGRGLAAYRRALDWILHTEKLMTEQAA
jgi:chromosome partitioning protein